MVKALKGAGLLKIGVDSAEPAAAVVSAPSKPGRVKVSKVRRSGTWDKSPSTASSGSRTCRSYLWLPL